MRPHATHTCPAVNRAHHCSPSVRTVLHVCAVHTPNRVYRSSPGPPSGIIGETGTTNRHTREYTAPPNSIARAEQAPDTSRSARVRTPNDHTAVHSSAARLRICRSACLTWSRRVAPPPLVPTERRPLSRIDRPSSCASCAGTLRGRALSPQFCRVQTRQSWPLFGLANWPSACHRHACCAPTKHARFGNSTLVPHPEAAGHPVTRMPEPNGQGSVILPIQPIRFRHASHLCSILLRWSDGKLDRGDKHRTGAQLAMLHA